MKHNVYSHLGALTLRGHLAYTHFILRRNPLENRVIVPTTGQKSHHALRAKLWCRKAFWHGFETNSWKAFSSRQKKKWKYRNNWKKISVKANCPTISFVSWILFRKEWTWPTLQSNSNRRSLSTRSIGSRKRLSPEMISFAAWTVCLKKNWLNEVKEYFSVFSYFIIFCDHSVLACLLRDDEVCDNWLF